MIALVERFWTRVNKDGLVPEHCPELGPCWVWIGARNSEHGYGQLTVGGRRRLTHRLAWEWAHGPIPEGDGYHGTCVLHCCDNPPCCNPAHLRLGTNAENVRDMHAKGRHARGERMGSSKLTAASVRTIRERFEARAATQSQLARTYGISPVTIHAIVRGRTWRHVA